MYKLLKSFENIFRGQVYRHRSSTIGDSVAALFYEDLYELSQSQKLTSRLRQRELAINTGNQIKGQKGRRGDGTFGRVIPNQPLLSEPGFAVPRGPLAHLQIGAEFKIGATKLIAQVDRVINDLQKQARIFREHNPDAIRVAFVGVNFADSYVGHEGDRQFIAKIPPVREATEFARRIDQIVRPSFDELLILRFKAPNSSPYEFDWLELTETQLLYASVLVRVSAEYERRF